MIKSLATIEKALGQEIDDVSYYDVRTGQVDNLSEIKSELVIVNIWGTFCPPCVKELPDLMRIENKYKGRLKVIALSNEAPEIIEQFLDNKEAPSIIGSILDIDWVDPQEFLPVSIFIKNDLIISKHMGRLPYDEMERLCCSN